MKLIRSRRNGRIFMFRKLNDCDCVASNTRARSTVAHRPNPYISTMATLAYLLLSFLDVLSKIPLLPRARKKIARDMLHRHSRTIVLSIYMPIISRFPSTTSIDLRLAVERLSKERLKNLGCGEDSRIRLCRRTLDEHPSREPQIS